MLSRSWTLALATACAAITWPAAFAQSPQPLKLASEFQSIASPAEPLANPRRARSKPRGRTGAGVGRYGGGVPGGC